MRTTRDVDILLRRSDLKPAAEAMEAAGFVYRDSAATDMFLDATDAKSRDAVHVLIAGEKMRDTDLVAAPDVGESLPGKSYRT